MAAIEQMMRSRLVIASDIGGLGEIVNGAGLKFPPGDAVALAGCMQKVIENPDLRLDLNEKAKQRAGRLFRLERRIDEHLRLCLSQAGSLPFPRGPHG